MIIFDLDGTLADCEHRTHFVEEPPMWIANPEFQKTPMVSSVITNPAWRNFKPDWDAFYEACDKDLPIQPVMDIWNDQISLGGMGQHQIWSGRSESVREKTEEWLKYHLLCFESHQLKMRPIGDSTPDDVLKEKWLDEALAKGETIDYVFDDRKKVCDMWRRRGIFVFNCAQRDAE